MTDADAREVARPRAELAAYERQLADALARLADDDPTNDAAAGEAAGLLRVAVAVARANLDAAVADGGR